MKFFSASVVWSVGFVLLAFANYFVTRPSHAPAWNPWTPVDLGAVWFGFFLAYAGFAGGLKAPPGWASRSVAVRAFFLSLVSYGLLAYGSPVARYHRHAASGIDVSIQYPYGAETPGNLRALRSAVEADPPDRYSFSVDDPARQPPNWLTYRIHSPAALALFAVLAALLGWQVGFLTTGLSPPVRRNARWALGLLGSAAFFVAQAAADKWVRVDPSRSGVAGAWAPLVVPALELVLLTALVRLQRRRLHASDFPDI